MEQSIRLCLVFPVCSKDEHLLLQFIDALDRFGDTPKYPALIVMSPDNAVSNLDALEERLRKHYSSVSRLYIPDALAKRKWPTPQNNAFKRTCQYFIAMQPRMFDAFFWIEPDCYPLRKEWLDTLASEYTENKKPWMGVVKRRPPLRPGYDPRPYLNGVALYPIDVLIRTPQIVVADETPWDILVGDIPIPETQDSEFMKGEHNATKFSRIDENTLSFTQTTGEVIETKTLDVTKAVFFHGVKDTSIAECFTEKRPVETPKKKRSLGSVLSTLK